MSKKKIAIVGATGMVGRTFLEVLEEYKMTDYDYTLLASARSAGNEVEFMGKTHIVKELTEQSFDEGFDIALFSAGGGTSAQFAPIAAEKGAIVIDNSAQWRMDKKVPLVVPEVNPEDIDWQSGIIANPNCSTIQAVVALAPLHKEYKIKRIIYSTYQAVSGAGVKGHNDLESGVKGFYESKEYPLEKFPYPIFNNCIPHIDVFLEDGYTKEERKMILETQKILHDDNIAVTATTVRVPVFNSHSESINIEFEKSFEVEDIKKLLSNSPGVTVVDDVQNNKYPLPLDATGHDDAFVGRIRRDTSVENGLNLWCVSDNIRKGAASNAVQIAKLILDK